MNSAFEIAAAVLQCSDSWSVSLSGNLSGKPAMTHLTTGTKKNNVTTGTGLYCCRYKEPSHLIIKTYIVPDPLFFTDPV